MDPDRRQFRNMSHVKGTEIAGSPVCQDLRHFKQILYLTGAQNGAFVKGDYKKGWVFLGLQIILSTPPLQRSPD